MFEAKFQSFEDHAERAASAPRVAALRTELARRNLTGFVVTGFLLSVVFQVAHCVEEADFPQPREGTGSIEKSWAVHQVETTVDYARRSRGLAWFLGGLNFQIEHHLFPRICHVNYPAISRVVEQTCRDWGVRYSDHRSFWAGMASHFRWLRRMGMPASDEERLTREAAKKLREPGLYLGQLDRAAG